MESVSHVLTLKERQSLELSGVREVKSFDPAEIELVTSQGPLLITGAELSIGSLDLASGLVSVSGKVTSLEYLPPAPEKKALFSRLFGGR